MAETLNIRVHCGHCYLQSQPCPKTAPARRYTDQTGARMGSIGLPAARLVLWVLRVGKCPNNDSLARVPYSRKEPSSSTMFMSVGSPLGHLSFVGHLGFQAFTPRVMALMLREASPFGDPRRRRRLRKQGRESAARRRRRALPDPRRLGAPNVLILFSRHCGSEYPRVLPSSPNPAFR